MNFETVCKRCYEDGGYQVLTKDYIHDVIDSLF